MQCTAITKAGTRCRRITTDPSGLCYQHKKELASNTQNITQISTTFQNEKNIANEVQKSNQTLFTLHLTLAEIVNFFSNAQNNNNSSANINRAKAEEKIIDNTRICPLKLQEIHNADPQKLQVLLKDNFYQFNILEGILCLTSELLNSNDLRQITEAVHQWFLNPKLLGKGVNGYALSSDLGDAKSLVVVKSSINPEEDDLVHELFVGLFGLNALRAVVPNFSFIYGGFKCGAPDVSNNNVLAICTGNTSVHYVLYENIPGNSLEKTLSSLTPKEFVAIYLQLLYAINEARSSGFTHYDLHAENIMLRVPFSQRFAIPYNTENGVEYILSNKIATIIDYGYSHIEYKGKHYGKYGIENFGVLPNKSFPLFDAYKVLLFCMRFCRKNNLRLLKTMIPILKYFTDDDYNDVITVHAKYFYSLPDIENLSKFSVLDLASYVRNVADASEVVSEVPSGMRILQCEGSCFTLQEVLA